MVNKTDMALALKREESMQKEKKKTKIYATLLYKRTLF